MSQTALKSSRGNRKNGSVDYHRPRSVEELIQQNIDTIAQLEHSAKAELSQGDRMADMITRVCGSTPFVMFHILWFALWIAWNVLPGTKSHHWDPFPFQFLTLTVSLEAIFLSLFILNSQNQQGKIAERRNHLDLQINLLSEQENTKMLMMLEAISDHLGITDSDPDVRILEEATRPEQMVEQIRQTIEQDRQRAQ